MALELPTIALTATALPGGRKECLAAGMDDFLTKPVTIAVLRDALVRHIKTPADPIE
jgi:CheY-like chemotaxis protein